MESGGKKIKIPDHVAIIMDGNGRWAQLRGLPRLAGHREGVKRAREAVEFSYRNGIKYLTLFAFSTENWQRPREEVEGIIQLLREYLRKELPDLKENRVKLKVIGDLTPLPEEVRREIETAEEELKEGDRLTLIVAFSYGGRQEIIRAVKKIVSECKNGTVQNISEEYFRKFLFAPEIPDPDLLIRTGGEQRISNFLLFQIAYTELYFTKTLWPDFTSEEFKRAIEDYSRRERRFGRVGKGK